MISVLNVSGQLQPWMLYPKGPREGALGAYWLGNWVSPRTGPVGAVNNYIKKEALGAFMREPLPHC
jgi:hypothetical protein